jgi:hypothetical protein
MRIGYVTLILEIYERVGNWLNIDPKICASSGRFISDGKRTPKLEPNEIERNDKNIFTYLN